MSRIAYALLTNDKITGGQKVILRHVEALIELGFDAVCLTDAPGRAPRWLEHRAPVEPSRNFGPDDVLVVPDDGPAALAVAARRAGPAVVLCQSSAPYLVAGGGLANLAEHRERLRTFISVGPRHAAMLRRLFPWASVEVVRGFADERVFRPGEKRFAGAFMPRKRPLEAEAIRQLAQRLHPSTAQLEWRPLENTPEPEMAAALAGASVFLSLSRMESLGLATLEALASGCVCAGFTGGGGAEYVNPDNGFWAPDDDCLAAADALAEAAAVVREGGARLAAMRAAALETAALWSHAAFKRELGEVWARLAPAARRS
jgi:glycosyltransferase involved in cell wall biosynthesis